MDSMHMLKTITFTFTSQHTLIYFSFLHFSITPFNSFTATLKTTQQSSCFASPKQNSIANKDVVAEIAHTSLVNANIPSKL